MKFPKFLYVLYINMLHIFQKKQICNFSMVLASGDRDHILSGVFSQFLSEKSEPAE